MPHGIERFGNGLAAFVSGRKSAWHQLGTVTRDCLTAQEAMELAYLSGWNVRKELITANVPTDDGVVSLEIPGRYATVRTHPITKKPEVLGVVGSKYLPVQNEACAELLNLLADSSGAHFETAGSLNGGRQIFVSMKLPRTMRIGGIDNHDLYLVASTSHDGSSPLRVDATPVRVVCLNTLKAAIGGSRGTYSLRHTKSVRHNIQQARNALDISFDYFDKFEQAAQRMINETLTTERFWDIVSQIWPVKKDMPPRARANETRRADKLNWLFGHAPTQKNIEGTRWAGYQAIVEYLDHFSPAKEEATRANRVIISEQVNGAKFTAYELLAV